MGLDDQGCAITYMIDQRIQRYIWGHICGGERTEAHPAGVRCVYVTVVMWD
jgi:hypothetical protein